MAFLDQIQLNGKTMSNDALNKTCSNCGQRKPLSAFLQLDKSGKMQYGTICASCRKTLNEDALHRRKTEAEGSGTQETGRTIDTKARMQAEHDKRVQFTEIEEDYHKERDLSDIDAQKQTDKKEIKTQTEKKHRDALFSQRHATTDKKPTAVTTPAEKAQLEQHNLTEEQKKTQQDYNAPFIDPQVAGQARFHSAMFQEYRKRLGRHSSLLQNMQKGNAQEKKSGGNKNETLAEHIEKNFGPGSRKK